MSTAIHYATVFVFSIAYISAMSWLFRICTRRSRAKRTVDQTHPTFYILTDQMSEALHNTAEHIRREYGVEPIISAKLPQNAGENIVTIEEVGPVGDREIFVEHIDCTIFCKVERHCKCTLPACKGAITQVLAA